MTNLRKVEIFKDNSWVEIKFEDLEVGNKFRMFEPDDGSPVIDKGKEFEAITEWIVTKGPYKRSEDGAWTVQTAGD